jgi:hypothetical protein
MVTESTQKAVSQATCSHLLCARQRPAHFDSVRGQRSYFCAHPQSHGLLSVPRRSAITRPPRRVNCPAREGLAISSQQRHAACNMIRDHDRAGLQALRLSRTSSLAADRVIWPPAQPALTGLPMLGSAAQVQHHSHHDAQRPPPGRSLLSQESRRIHHHHPSSSHTRGWAPCDTAAKRTPPVAPHSPQPHALPTVHKVLPARCHFAVLASRIRVLLVSSPAS